MTLEGFMACPNDYMHRTWEVLETLVVGGNPPRLTGGRLRCKDCRWVFEAVPPSRTEDA